MSNPRVSVVTPSYNQAAFVEDTIRSVANQSYDDVEHVVQDGGSTDGTLDVLERSPGVEWTSEDDDGQADAVNRGFERATGDIVGWLNSDDVYFDTGVVERVVGYFERTGADVVYGDVAVVDADSTVLKFWKVPDFDRRRLLRYCFVEQPAVFLDADVLTDERLDTDLEYAMDYEFWLRLSEEHAFVHVDDVLAADRNHPDRKILAERAEMEAEAREVARTYGGGAGGRLARALDVAVSGVPRGLSTLAYTVRYHGEADLAFDGAFAPLPRMLVNAVRPNRTLV